MRRAERKEGREEDKKKTKKATRKRTAKLTTPEMENAESKTVDTSTATAQRMEIAEAKQAPVEARACAEAKETMMPDARGRVGIAPATAADAVAKDEDPDLREEPEDDESDHGSWTDDWDIGYLTDEETAQEAEELPDSIWLSAAKDKRLIASMRDNGWEYDTSKFGADPEYHGLYDGPYDPNDGVLGVSDDQIALLFYFMPPKLWSQIAVESNTYHKQTIPARARAIRAQPRRRGDEVEDLGEIRRRLASVPDIQAFEVLRVMALLIARMLAPNRKGIASHWSTKRVGAMPTTRFKLYMGKHRFFHIMGYLHFSNYKSPQARQDRVWKIRRVVNVLQRTFARGYKAPPARH
ncbi:uncharacterized protein IUM83_12861 [Phytophthora cinnamomi]|uniref:uncharacterized protein n=1 Tax=Phytophthora cinnamomi TaxID=4785 RepID=UPI003559523F|nr:hypothetical protein IUM83_12861 [Phytophthora cinnamomi]